MTSELVNPVSLPPGPKGHFLFGTFGEYVRDPLGYSGSQIDEVQQQQSANNSQGLVGYLSYSRTAISLFCHSPKYEAKRKPNYPSGKKG